MNKKTGFIIYLDLLGYKNIIKSNDSNQQKELQDFVNDFIDIKRIKDKAKDFYEDFDEDKFLFRCFSDNFIIFYESQDIEITNLIISIFLGSYLLGSAIKRGYMFRGSLVFGDIIYNDNIVFGNSIVRAYELENNHIEPSIVLSSELKKEYEKNELYKNEIISPFSFCHNNDCEEAKVFFDGIKKMVSRLNTQSIVDDKTIAKYNWLVKEFNRYFNGYASISFNSGAYHYDVDYLDASRDI